MNDRDYHQVALDLDAKLKEAFGELVQTNAEAVDWERDPFRMSFERPLTPAERQKLNIILAKNADGVFEGNDGRTVWLQSKHLTCP